MLTPAPRLQSAFHASPSSSRCRTRRICSAGLHQPGTVCFQSGADLKVGATCVGDEPGLEWVKKKGAATLSHTSLLARLGPACSTGRLCLGTNMSASVSPHLWAIW